jgi:hypothetical protein
MLFTNRMEVGTLLSVSHAQLDAHLADTNSTTTFYRTRNSGCYLLPVRSCFKLK